MWKGCDPGKAFTAKSPLQGLRLAEGPVHPQLSPGYYQNALPRGSESSYLAVFYLFSSREAFQVRRSLSDSRGTLVGLCHKKPRVRDALPCFASKKCVPSRLPYAWQGGDRTTMPPAGGGDAQVRPSAFQPVAVAPRKPPIRPPGSVLCCPESSHRRHTRPSTRAPLQTHPFPPLRFVRTSGSCKRASRG